MKLLIAKKIDLLCLKIEQKKFEKSDRDELLVILENCNSGCLGNVCDTKLIEIAKKISENLKEQPKKSK